MDIQILLFLQNLREASGGVFTSLFALITTIAVDYWVILPAMIIFWTVDKKKGQILIFSAGIGRFFTAIIKSIFCVYRPWVRSKEIKPLESALPGATGYSFPSGHSASTSALYAALAKVFKERKGLCVFCWIMIVLTMLSRCFVGVHTPQDVIAGVAIGVASPILGEKILAWVDKHPDKDWVVLVVTTVIMIAALLFIRFKAYPEDFVDGKILVDPKKMTVDGFKDPGTCFGMIVGWFIERRFIKFDLSGTTYQKILRCLFGSMGYIFMLQVIANPLGKAVGDGFVHFLLQAMVPAFFITVYPIIFKKIEAKFPDTLTASTVQDTVKQ